jgi:hypothetical protein
MSVDVDTNPRATLHARTEEEDRNGQAVVTNRREALRAAIGKATDALHAKALTKEQATKLYELADRRAIGLDEGSAGKKGA